MPPCSVETLTGLSHAGVWRAAARGDLPSVRIGKRILFPKRAIEALIANAVEQAPLARSRNDAAWAMDAPQRTGG